MANINYKVDFSKLDKKFDKLKTLERELMPQVFDEFVAITPIAEKNGGNARRNTTYNGNVIAAMYPYATVLDDGRHLTERGMRGSLQAPEGMSKPTLKKVPQMAKDIVKRLGK